LRIFQSLSIPQLDIHKPQNISPVSIIRHLFSNALYPEATKSHPALSPLAPRGIPLLPRRTPLSNYHIPAPVAGFNTAMFSIFLTLPYIIEFVTSDVFTVNSYPEADLPVECQAYLDATNELWMKFYLAELLYITLCCVMMGLWLVSDGREVDHKFAMELAEATPEEREERLQMICRANGGKVRRRENVGGEKGDIFLGN
jgi:hypothetical protein